MLIDNLGVLATDVEAVLQLPDSVTLDDVLTDRHQLTPSDLVALSDVLEVPATVLSGQVPINRHLGVSLRLGALQSTEAPNAALQYAEKLLQYQALLDSWLGRVSNPLANVSMSTDPLYVRAGEVSAARVRDGLSLGAGPIDDLVSLVERLGFPVAFLELPDNVAGLNVRDEREGYTSRVIIISCREAWTRQRYTLAHELCHALYDDEGQVIVDNVDSPDLLPERRADSFARNLLLPKRSLKQAMNDAPVYNGDLLATTAQLMIRWGLSREAIARTLQYDGFITARDMNFILEQRVSEIMSLSGFAETWQRLSDREGEPSGSPLLVERALQAYRNGWVSSQVVADLLGADRSETEQVLLKQGWT
ncbi:ImmA/IrrE family metallo-endopeptidase [Pseudonocardia sp. Cha107L01]|uniref:ImmA/IrrE family metallo-endopeptidase n=1 Tax=Pseudonocardia sp. Cha107L01 TaxID=3457576 RepID=UPI00403ED4B5